MGSLSNSKFLLTELLYEKKRLATLERQRVYAIKWRKKHPGYKRAWTKAHPGYDAKYRQRNREKIRAYNTTYQRLRRAR